MIELFRRHSLLVQSAEDGSFLLARSPEQLGVLDLLHLVRQGELRTPPAEPRTDSPGIPNNLSALSGQTIKDLANQSLESIQTITF
jgi:hypothetical protein